MKNKMTRYFLIFVLLAGLQSCGNNDSVRAINNDNSDSEIQSNKDEISKAGDDAISNASKALKPKGKMSFKADGQPVLIDENQVQCMYISMGGNLAQAVISGGNQISITHLGIPNLGDIDTGIKSGVPSVAIRLEYNGVEFQSLSSKDLKLSLSRITPNGKNFYVAGSFSGTLYSREGKEIVVTDGQFESAYL